MNWQRGDVVLCRVAITGDETVAVGIRVDSIVRCESIFTLNQSMVLRKLGKLSEATIDRLNGCLIAALSL